MCKHMLWKTHIRISFEVLNRLGISLSPEETENFKKGIIAPDKWKDYPHHHGKSENIKQHMMKSRGFFLKDDLPLAFFHLGVALHYIQDSYTSFASFYPKHQSWEESIECANFTYDLIKTINYSLRDKEWERNRCLGLAGALSKKAQGRDNTLYLATLSGHEASKSFAKPIVDLNLALRASYVVTESVLSSKKSLALENKLKDDLSNYEVLIRTAEVELTDKIIRLANEREALKVRKVPPSGIISKIKNWILGIRIRLKDSAVNSNYKSYTQRTHLEKVATEYVNAAKKTVAPYIGWYNFQIPKLNPNAVRNELLTVQEIAEVLGENENALKESLNRVKIWSYCVGNTNLVKRAELDRFLSHFPVNGFTKYPYESVECVKM
jgi:hypothetical protein